jgi:hypothetical protein
MSQNTAIQFLTAVRDGAALRAAYRDRNLLQVVFHARDLGYDLTAEDLVKAVARLEFQVIVEKDRQPFDGGSRLWRGMWGKTYLDYVVEHVLGRFSDAELRALFAPADAAAGSESPR